MNTNVEELIAYPQRYFDRPDKVLNEPTLTVDQKRRILESWKLDAQRLAEKTDLREVSKVLLQLKSMEAIPVAHQPKESSSVGAGMAAGALLGAGAGLVITAITVPSLVLVAQASVVGLILGGVGGAVRKSMR